MGVEIISLNEVETGIVLVISLAVVCIYVVYLCQGYSRSVIELHKNHTELQNLNAGKSRAKPPMLLCDFIAFFGRFRTCLFSRKEKDELNGTQSNRFGFGQTEKWRRNDAHTLPLPCEIAFSTRL